MAQPPDAAAKKRSRSSQQPKGVSVDFHTGALLVDFLNQLVFLHETEEVGFSRIRVTDATETALTAEVDVVPISGEPEGPPVKGATFHRLRVDRSPDRVEAQVYLDV